MIRQRRPKAAADILSTVFHAPVVKEKLRRYSTLPEWSSVVGEALSKVSIPEKLIRGKILVVSVLDAAWSQELTLMKAELIERIRALSPSSCIEDIKFTTGNPKNFSSKQRA